MGLRRAPARQGVDILAIVSELIDCGLIGRGAGASCLQDNVMTVFQGGGARDPFEDAEGILTVTQPDGTVPLDMFTTLSLGAYTENIEEKVCARA